MIERFRSVPKEPLHRGTIHRLIPSNKKHRAKTACGIEIISVHEGSQGLYAVTQGSYKLAVSEKGKPFDCKRCNRVLLLRHENAGFNISMEV